MLNENARPLHSVRQPGSHLIDCADHDRHWIDVVRAATAAVVAVADLLPLFEIN
jgi:hypothetical protein